MKRRSKYIVYSSLTAMLVLVAIIAITQIADKKAQATAIKKEAPAEEEEQVTNDDPWMEMEKLMAAYESKDGMTYKGLIKLLDANGEQDKVLEESPFEFTLRDNEYDYKLSGTEMINKENLLLIADHSTKTIALAPKVKASSPGMLFNSEAIRKLLLERKAQAKVTRTKTEKIVTIDSIQDPQVQGYRIYYSPDTYRIRKIEIGMMRLTPLQVGDADSDGETATSEDIVPPTESEKEEAESEGEGLDTYVYFLEILYTDIKPFGTGTFNPENKFIQTVNNTIQLTPAYQDYTLVNAKK